MKIFKNKYFILGNLFLLLISLPVILFFVKQQIDTRSSAAPSTVLSFGQPSTPPAIGKNFDIDVMINPGQNIVSTVDMDIRYDPTKLELVTITPNTTAFPVTLKGPTITSGGVVISVNIGGDVTRAVQTVTKAATITFKALAATPDGPTQVAFFQSPDPTKPTRVFSLAEPDGAGENVLSQVEPASITVQSSSTTPTPSTTSSLTPTPTSSSSVPTSTPLPTSTSVSPTPTTNLSPTPTGTGSSTTTNKVPVCTGFVADRDTNGTVPFSLTFTANGNDPDGTISKASFNFGDGPVQDVTQGGGVGTTSISVQIAHTYRNAGTFQASVTFTDNSGAVSVASTSCSKTVVVQPSPTTSSSSSTGGSGSSSSGATPTIPPTGNATTLLAIMGGILLTVVGGFLLFAL